MAGRRLGTRHKSDTTEKIRNSRDYGGAILRIHRLARGCLAK